MKIAILYDSKYGNTKLLAEKLAEKVQANNHDVKLFRTSEDRPKTLIAFQPSAILVGGPTHFGKPANKLSKYIKKLGKLVQDSFSSKAAVFNCYTGDDVTNDIKRDISSAFPEIKIMGEALAILTGDGTGENWNKVMLQESWEEEASSFISKYLDFLS